MRAHLTALFAHGAYTACHVRVFHQAPAEVQRRTTVARDRYEARWTELLAEAAADGVIRPEVDLTLARLFVLGALNASVEWFGEGGRTVDEVAAMFTALFLDGLFLDGLFLDGAVQGE